MKRYGSEICAALLLAVVISCFGGVIVYASSAENQITDQMELNTLWNSHRKTEGGGEK